MSYIATGIYVDVSLWFNSKVSRNELGVDCANYQCLLLLLAQINIKGSEFNFMRVLVLLVIFILLNILYFLFVL
jgi:hypothetical protein